MSNLNICAVIPARGGSKGIPGKNLKKIGGLPLIARAVRAARGASKVGHVFVSTDDAEIARVAAHSGATIIERPLELASDTASSEVVLLHALDTLAMRGQEPDILVFLQCTSPFIHPSDIDGTIEALLNANADAAFTAMPSHRFLWRKNDAEEIVGVNHNKTFRLRRQEREPEFAETGAVYVMRVKGFRKARHRFFGRIAIHEVPSGRALEIDAPEDLDAARLLAPSYQIKPALHHRVRALVMDFDGVLTDNRVFVDQHGTETVACSRGDGLGLEKLRTSGIALLVLSKEKNPVVTARCKKLRIEVLQGIDDKLPAMEAWLKEKNISSEAAIYVGNDINDVECIEAAGVGMAPSDAHPTALKAADWVLDAPGGNGAVREICDIISELNENCGASSA